MKSYLIALTVGLLVGIIYGALNVRSPAPPIIALVGLLGILVGEQVVPIAKHLARGHNLNFALLRLQCGEHVFGTLPMGASGITSEGRSENKSNSS